jgi:hypothetical protein
MKILNDKGEVLHECPDESALLVLPPDDAPMLLVYHDEETDPDSTVPPHTMFATEVFVYIHEREHMEEMHRFFEQKAAEVH